MFEKNGVVMRVFAYIQGEIASLRQQLSATALALQQQLQHTYCSPAAATVASQRRHCCNAVPVPLQHDQVVCTQANLCLTVSVPLQHY